MAKNSNNILDQAREAGLARPDGGMRVPAGYFDSFADQMSAMLPDRPELRATAEADRPRSFWESVRPYVYMAAMFAGVWCMLQMFHMMSGGNELAPMDSNPVLAQGLATDDFLYDYVMSDVSSRDIFDDMVDDGLMPDNFDMTALNEDLLVDSETNQILPQ